MKSPYTTCGLYPRKQTMNAKTKKLLTPISLPILFFLVAILIGTSLLHSPVSNNTNLSWLDALFTATSAVCVTGLAVVDTGSGFSQTGQTIILLLIQLGGLGIMSFSSLALYLWKKKVSLTDRIAVGQNLLHDSKFNLGKFLIQIVSITMVIELSGAIILSTLDSGHFAPFSALFHSVSAFCNAGFSLNPDSLMRYRGNWSVNLTFMTLIILGGVGFTVIIEGKSIVMALMRDKKLRDRNSWHFNIVLKTSIFLIVAGWLYLYFSEFINFKGSLPSHEALLASLFQSISCRTAGFNTLDLSTMTNVGLIFMLFLMFIGGAPGSCAGGIKITTFRVLTAFITSQVKGQKQVVINRYAVDKESLNKALTLLFFSLIIIIVSVLALDFSEGGDIPHIQARGQFLEIVFEVVSAFGTVGLSMGLTAKLSVLGKMIIIILMFIGRLGPLIFLASMQSMRSKILYSLPEEKLSIG